MKKLLPVFVVLELAVIIVLFFSLTDEFEFNNQSKASQNSVYPITPDFKAGVNQALDELLLDKIFDLEWKKLFFFQTLFESLTGFTVSGPAPTIDGTGVTMTTDGTLNNESEVTKQPGIQGLIAFYQRSAFRIKVYLAQVTAQTIYITVGNKDTTHYYGFKIVDNTLYGVTYNGVTENAVSLQSVSATTSYNLEARYFPDDKVVFFVDAVEKGVSKLYLPVPSTTINVQLMDIRVKATAAVAKTIKVSMFQYMQARAVLN